MKTKLTGLTLLCLSFFIFSCASSEINFTSTTTTTVTTTTTTSSTQLTGSTTTTTSTTQSTASTSTTTTTTVPTTTVPGVPPSNVTSIEAGSGGTATAEVSTDRGTVYSIVIDSLTKDPLTNLLAENIAVFVTPSGEASYECSVISLTNQAGQTTDPISFALVLDRSGGMSTSMEATMEEAALDLIDNMQAGDEAMIINFSKYVGLDQTLTSDKNLLKWAATNESVLNLSTALYEGLGVGLVSLDAQSVNNRKMVIAMTDGKNNETYTWNTSQEIVDLANNNNLPIHGVALGTFFDEAELRYITSQTGGLYYYASTASELAGLYNNISSAISSYYVVKYTLPSGKTFQSGQTYAITFLVVDYGGLSASATYYLTIP